MHGGGTTRQTLLSSSKNEDGGFLIAENFRYILPGQWFKETLRSPSSSKTSIVWEKFVYAA